MFAKNSIDPKKEIKFQAYIGQACSWWDYYSHYKTAIDFIVEGIEKNVSVNTISLPTVYLIRHCLELGFKANILKFETISSARPKLELKSHDLKDLYEIFKDHLLHITTNNPIDSSLIEKIKNDLKITEKLKLVLHNLDNQSFNFRYPVNKKHKPNFKETEVINVAEIVKAFYQIQPFLVFVDAALYEQGVFGFNEY